VKSYKGYYATNAKEISFNEKEESYGPQDAKQSVFKKRRKVFCACSVLFL